MKFLVPIYSCFQDPWLGANATRSPFSLSSTEFFEPPRTKFLGTPLYLSYYYQAKTWPQTDACVSFYVYSYPNASYRLFYFLNKATP